MFFAKSAKPFGFWANAEVAEIKDVKGYNRALGKLWCIVRVVENSRKRGKTYANV